MAFRPNTQSVVGGFAEGPLTRYRVCLLQSPSLKCLYEVSIEQDCTKSLRRGDPDNAGLRECLVTGEHGISLQEVYQSFCTEVSLADFLVIAAEAVIASTRARHEQATPGAPQLDLRSSFRFGRTTSPCTSVTGSLPNPEDGCAAVEQVFATLQASKFVSQSFLAFLHSESTHWFNLSWT